MDEPTRLRHNALYNKALKLTESEIQMADQKHLGPPGLWTAFKLRRALSCLKQVFELNADNYAANWFAGKIHQRFRNHRDSLRFFRRAAELRPTQPDVLREASIAAMDCEEPEEAVSFAKQALEIEPNNPGLHANLALGLLLSGNAAEAAKEIEIATAADPSDTITAALAQLIKHFQSSGEPPPRTLAELRRVGGRVPDA
jgi:Flp pilus assembly protein TadD